MSQASEEITEFSQEASETDKPFGEAFNRLRRERGWTFRVLAAETRKRHADPTGRGLTNPYLVQLANGTHPPRRTSVEIIARALGKEPEYFAEYRLWAFQELFDFEHEGGLERALKNLQDYAVAVGSAGRRDRVAA
jgi:transcriptional regulator with XRE-family HTH domain